MIFSVLLNMNVLGKNWKSIGAGNSQDCQLLFASTSERGRGDRDSF